MAIKNLVPMLAERGKIKIGGLGDERQKKGSNETYRQPEKYDYFLITTVQRDAAGRLLADKELMEKLAKANGPTIPKGPYKGLPLIKEFPVRLLYDNIDLNFPTRYACYTGKRCWCSGDGETAQRLAGQNGNYQQVQCPCERLELLYQGKDKCKIMGTLQTLIEGTNRIGGVWKLRTTSWNSVNAILSSLALIKTITNGILAGIPLHMVVSPKTATIPGTGETMPIYVVSLEYRATGRKHLAIADGLSQEITLTAEEELAERGYEIARKRIDHRVKMEQIESEARKMLVGPQAESVEEQAETGAEFFSEGFSTDPGKEPGPGFPEGAAPELDGDVAPEQDQQQALNDSSSDPPAPAKGEDQGGEIQKPLTIPEVIEACQANTYIPVFPIPLVTTKGVKIGEWVGRKMDKMELHPTHVVFETRPDLTGATGLTKDRIAKSFDEAGYKVEFQEPGTLKKALAKEGAVIPPAAQVQAQDSNNNGGKPKSLF